MRRARYWLGEEAAAWQARWGVPRLRIYHSIASTNTLLLRLAARGAPHGTVVIADAQTAGRGRRGRRWDAPPGKALLLSLLLRPGGDAPIPGAVPIRIGAIVARAIRTTTGLAARLKWPNDILAPGGGKLGGVLCEGSIAPENGGYIVAGVGINVAQRNEDFGGDVRATATSLLLETGTLHERAPLAGAIVGAALAEPRIANRLDEMERAGIDRLHALHGERVTLDDVDAGIVQGVLDDGALAVSCDGRRRIIRNGTLRRAGGEEAAARR